MKESAFRFSKPVLKNIEYRINDEFQSDQKVHFHSHFHRNVIRSEDSCAAVVELTIEIGVDKRSVNAPFALLSVIMANFEWDETYDSETINNLLLINAPSLLLGYARPIISNITSNSIGQYDLPFMNFVSSDDILSTEE